MTTKTTYAAVHAKCVERGLCIFPDSRGAKHPRDLHEGKPVSVVRDDDTGATHIYRWDSDVDLTLIGRIE